MSRWAQRPLTLEREDNESPAQAGYRLPIRAATGQGLPLNPNPHPWSELTRVPTRREPRGREADNAACDPELREHMERVSHLRRLGDAGWAVLWRRISVDVAEACNRATNILRMQGFPVNEAVVHDGWVKEVTITAGDFLRYQQQLRAAIPNLLFVHLRGVKGNLDALARSEGVKPLVALDLSDNDLDDADLKCIAGSKFFENLRWLDIGENSVTNAGLGHIAQARYLNSLTYLAIDCNPCEDPMDALAVDPLTGEITQTRPTQYGRQLEAESPNGVLPWLHAARHYGRLFPPMMQDAAVLVREALD